MRFRASESDARRRQAGKFLWDITYLCWNFTRIGEIIAGRRGITADTDLRLCRFFGLSDGWWMRLQGDYDTRIARISLAKKLAKIKPWTSYAEHTITVKAS